MDVQSLVFSFFGGLALFLFGMNYMSDGLKNIGSNTFRQILQSLTKNRMRGILVGMGITCLIQSSSGTSVMVVGFVNAGLLALKQGLAVVLGANAGTTITAWMVSIMGKFKMTHYALPIIAAGFLVNFLAKRRKTKMIGQSLLGFGFLFLGLGTMSGGLEPLKDSDYIKDVFATFGTNPLLGILAGTVVTMILQSSSVTIAIVQVMAFQGLLGLEAALPLLLGDNIGTTITAQLAAIGGTKNARGVAMANTCFKVLGTILFIPFLLWGGYEYLIRLLVPGELQPSNIMLHIAVAHTVFNLVNIIIFSSLLWPFLIKAAKLLSFGRSVGVERESPFLDPLLLNDPPIAMQQTIFELVRMLEIAKGTVQDAQGAFFDRDLKKAEMVYEKEDVLDELQGNITAYLIQISEKDLGTRESKEYPVLLHSVNDIEKVGDYSSNIAGYTERQVSKKLIMADECLIEIRLMFEKLYELFDNVTQALKTKDTAGAHMAITIEDQIDQMKAQCRSQYISRLNKYSVEPEAEMMIMDVATNIEKMGDHLISIAKAALKDLQWGQKADLSGVGGVAE